MQYQLGNLNYYGKVLYYLLLLTENVLSNILPSPQT